MVSAEVDEVELKDGTKTHPVSVIFPEGNNIPAPNQNQVQSCAHGGPSAQKWLSLASGQSFVSCGLNAVSDHLHCICFNGGLYIQRCVLAIKTI